MTPLKTEFTFAGFNFPRYIADLPMGKSAMQRKRELRKLCGGYYHAPLPGRVAGWGFYDGESSLRIEQSGPFWCDEDGSTTMAPIVVRLNHNRGFLVGWTMGNGMAASIDSDILMDYDDACRVAKSRTEDAAIAEQEYQLQHREEMADCD